MLMSSGLRVLTIIDIVKGETEKTIVIKVL